MTAGLWSIYGTPSRRFLVIEWRLRPGGVAFEGRRSLVRTYRDARSLIPVGAAFRVPREPEDRPELLESWF